MQEDRYIFYPFREVEILKKPPHDNYRPSCAEIQAARNDNKTRKLAVAGIRDVIAQLLLYDEVLKNARPKSFLVNLIYQLRSHLRTGRANRRSKRLRLLIALYAVALLMFWMPISAASSTRFHTMRCSQSVLSGLTETH